MTDTTTVPGTITMLSGETLPIGIDFSLLVTAGQTPTTPTGVLYDITDASPGTVVTQGGALTLSGNVVTKTLSGLVANRTYRLLLGLTAATGVVWQAGVTIVCPF